MINCETCAKKKHCFVKEFKVEQCEDYISGGSVSMIKDSGNRREFETGAKRDCAEGKGDMVSLPNNAILRLSKHYENGAKNMGVGTIRKVYLFRHSLIQHFVTCSNT